MKTNDFLSNVLQGTIQWSQITFSFENTFVLVLSIIVVILSVILYKSIQLHKKLIQQPWIYQNCRILLIGSPGVGKTKIFNRILKLGNGAKESEFQHFSNLKLIQNYYLVDTPSIDMDSSIELREENIQKFQVYFRQYGHYITNMFITVNFERTDLMKGKINSVYKYFRRFNYMLGLIVSDFEKSENPEEDRIQLLKSFSIYNIPQNRILFVGDHQSPEMIKQQLISASDIFNIDLLENQNDIQIVIGYEALI